MIRFWMVIVLSLLFIADDARVSAATHYTQNFAVSAPTLQFARQVADAAETYRRELAIDWLGAPLPGNWSRACTVQCQVRPVSPGGATTFHFSKGEVFGWDMTLQGSEQRILDSVLPHEVLHTILASHFRRPLPRWADEGAATLVEHASERQRHKQMLQEILKSSRTMPLEELLRLEQYPRDRQQVLTLYAQGYSLTELLVQLRGKQRFVTFLGDALRQGWDTALRTHYGFEDLAHIEQTWQRWQAVGAPHFTAYQCTNGEWTPLDKLKSRGDKPVLEVWTNPLTCGPCRNLKEDWSNDSAFRQAITEKYCVHWFIVDESTWDRAQSKGIGSIPTFVIAGRKPWTGYADEQGDGTNLIGRKTTLLARLGIRTPPPPASPPQTPQPAPAYVTHEQLERALQEAFDEFTARMETIPGPPGPPGATGFRGAAGPQGLPGQDGQNGRGISRIFLDGGQLVVEFDDGTTQVAGQIPVPDSDLESELFTVVFEPGDEPGEEARTVAVERGGELRIPHQLLRIRSVGDSGQEVGEPMYDAAPLGMPVKLRFRKPLQTSE